MYEYYMYDDVTQYALSPVSVGTSISIEPQVGILKRAREGAQHEVYRAVQNTPEYVLFE